MSDEECGCPPPLALAFQLRDRDFRLYLTRAGYISGMQILVGMPGESWETIASRREDGDQDLMARPNPGAPYGWELRSAEEA